MRPSFSRAILLSIASSLAALAGCAVEPVEGEPPEEVSQSFTSATWQKLLTCDGAAAVVDVRANERRNLQLVVRDANILRYLHESGAVQLPFGATQAIFSGWTGHVDWHHPLGPRLKAQPYGSPGVFSPGELKELIANHNTYEGAFGRFVRVARQGSGLLLQIGTIEKRGCAEDRAHYVGDGFGWQTTCVADYSAYVEQASWYFQHCE